mgnify:CR=1 FL=1
MVELLVSLAITAMLLTATMVAIDASFKAYAGSAEEAATAASTRLVTHRLLTLVRTSTAHGPLLPDATTDPPVTYDSTTSLITSHYLELIDTNGDLIRIEYDADTEQLMMTRTGGGTTQTEPILAGVTSATFYAKRRLDRSGVFVLERGTMDLTIMPGADATLSLESGTSRAIRVIASTMPRRLEN